MNLEGGVEGGRGAGPSTFLLFEGTTVDWIMLRNFPTEGSMSSEEGERERRGRRE